MMIKHLFEYTTKVLFKSNEGLLWGILFPFAFGIVYMFAFSGILSGTETFDPVPVAMVYEGSEEEVEASQEAFADLGASGEIVDNEVVSDDVTEDDLVVFTEVEADQVRDLIDSGTLQLAAFVENNEGTYDINLEVSPSAANSVESSIVYSMFNSFSTINDAYVEVFTEAATSDDPQAVVGRVSENLADIELDQDYVVNSADSEGVNTYSNFYYVCLAYICIFFMNVGTFLVTNNEANYSAAALRETVSPVHKYKRFATSFVVWLIPCLLVVYLLLAIFWATDVPLGTEYGRIIGLVSLGVVVGLLLGTAFAGIFKANQDVLTGVATAVPLIFGAFSGLMSYEIKTVMADWFPWLEYVNPVTLVNDGLYFLNNYPTYDQYNQNVLILAVYAVILFIVTIVSIRRTDYESL